MQEPCDGIKTDVDGGSGRELRGLQCFCRYADDIPVYVRDPPPHCVVLMFLETSEDLLRLRHFHWLLLSEAHLTVSSWIRRAVSSLMVEDATFGQTLFLQPRCFYFCSQRCIMRFHTLDQVLPLDSELYSSLSLSLETTKCR